jgi:hypothetical protein
MEHPPTAVTGSARCHGGAPRRLASQPKSAAIPFRVTEMTAYLPNGGALAQEMAAHATPLHISLGSIGYF